MTKEALKLALEALVLNNAEWKHLADSGDSGYWSAEDQNHYKQTEQAIIAIKEALANEALDKMAENARELGLDYEPPQPEHGWTPERIAGMARLKEAQDKKLAQPEQEPVAFICEFYADEGHPFVSFEPVTHGTNTPLYASPPPVAEPHKRPSRSDIKPLTDEEIGAILEGVNAYGTRLYTFARAIEAAHGIKGEV